MRGSGPKGKILLTDLRTDWREYIISECTDGASKTELRAGLDMTQKAQEALYKREDEFAEIWDRGMNLSKAWWYKLGRKHLNSRNFNSTLWYMNMKNRHGWKDKQDVTSNDKTVSGVIMLPAKRGVKKK